MEVKRTNDQSEHADSNASPEENAVKRMRNDTVEIDCLPIEMLEEILRNVATPDLRKCRQMNRRWNEISSKIMRQRGDTTIVIPLQNGEQTHVIHQFSDLIKCLKQSSNFPVVSFRFKHTIENENMEQFLSIWGSNIRKLGVKISAAEDIQMLKGLLLERSPNLENLLIDFGSHWPNEQKLFDDSNEFRILNLNVLRVRNMSEQVCGIIADILKAALNLHRFDLEHGDGYWDIDSTDVHELTMIQSLDKLHCLKRVNLSYDEELVNFLEKSPQFLNIQFEAITLGMNKLLIPYDSRDAENLSKLFDSSQKSLLGLNMSSLGFPGMVLPVFENLEKLILSRDYQVWAPMFPLHSDMSVNFPNLRELVVDILGKERYFSAFQPSGVMPKAEFLHIIGDFDYSEKLMKMMPNLKTLLIEGEKDDNLPNVEYDAISTHLTKLETLKWEFYAGSQRELQLNCQLESLITGFSEKFCKKMSLRFRDKESLSAQEIDSYDAAARMCFSILDLKGLKRLDIKLTYRHDYYKINDSNGKNGSDDEDSDCGCNMNGDDESCDAAPWLGNDKTCDMAGFHPGSIFYKTGLTKVSKFLAFDLMPDLQTNIEFSL